MYPLIETYPKQLLPVNNKPAIFYQLDLLQEYGFKHAYVLLPQEENKQSHLLVQKYLKENYKGEMETKIFYFESNCSEIEALKNFA